MRAEIYCSTVVADPDVIAGIRQQIRQGISCICVDKPFLHTHIAVRLHQNNFLCNWLDRVSGVDWSC